MKLIECSVSVSNLLNSSMGSRHNRLDRVDSLSLSLFLVKTRQELFICELTINFKNLHLDWRVSIHSNEKFDLIFGIYLCSFCAGCHRSGSVFIMYLIDHAIFISLCETVFILANVLLPV